MGDVRDFALPDLGEGLEDAEVVTWRVAVGDVVELNQILVEVNTAKALVEIPSPWAGVIERLHAPEGAVVDVGSALVSIRVGSDAPPSGGAGGSASKSSEVGSTPGAPASAALDLGSTPGAPAGQGGSKRTPVLVGYGAIEDEPAFVAPAPTTSGERAGPVAATPPVRRLAKELGVDLTTVTGTGPDGRVTREDVQRAAGQGAGRVEPTSTISEAEPAPPPGAPPPRGSSGDRRVPVRGVRRLMAEKMARSVREIPQVTTFLTVDCTHMLGFRDQLRATTGERLSVLPILIAALARTIDTHPKLNASFDADVEGGPEVVLHGERNIGVAADTPQGLLVPVVRGADRLGIAALAAELTRLTEAARAGRATPADLTGGTVTVSNVGTFGAEFGTPIVNHPEGAILAIGLIEPRALVVDGRVEPRPATTLSLTFDHRLMDGGEAGRALRAFGDLLESPFELGSLPR